MAFTMDGIIIDRIQMGVAEDFNGNLLYTLCHLSDGKIDITANAKEAKDETETLIKKFWQGKTGTFIANNAMLDFNVLGSSAGGAGKVMASNATPIIMPKVVVVPAGTATLDITGFISGTVHVAPLANNGTMGTECEMDTAASATTFSISTNTLTLPTTTTTQYIVKYNRSVVSGVKIENSANQFPGTIRLTLKALAVDPCSADTVRACYIYLPSFQVSPETSISLTTDAQFEFKGDLQSDYCAADKKLYAVYMAEESEN